MAAYTADELLGFAIDQEQEAHEFYMDLVGKAARPETKELLMQLAKEEIPRRMTEGVAPHGKQTRNVMAWRRAHE